MPHKKNYHSIKLKFLALKRSVTEHFKEYMPYQSFIVWTDNNPLMYILSTPNLDATGHWWVGALVQFNFKLEYQKGHDNTVADLLSWVTTWLNPETIKSILDGITLGMAPQAEVHDLAMLEGDQCMQQEVCVATGCPLVEMHVTDWAEAQREDPTLSAVLDWLEAQTKTDLKVLLAEHASSKEGNLILSNWQNVTIHQGPCICTQCSRLRPKISCFLWSPRHIMLPPWMGATEIQAIKGVIKPYPCCENVSCGQEWQAKCRNPWSPAHIACTMRQVVQGTPTPNHFQHSYGCLTCRLYEYRDDHWANRLPKVANVLVFQDHFTKHVMAYMTPDQTAKTVAKFLYQGYISISGTLARLLSVHGANFISNIISEMCKLLGMKKLHTTPYHPRLMGW